MSKIQEALRKIQGGAPEHEKPRVLTVPIARLTRDDPTVLKSPFAHDSRLVVIDRNMLRRNGLLAPENQARFVADQYRLIKRPILANVARNRARGESSPMNLAMVASALPGDGKTFNCINLALSIASERDISVVLVDADVAKPHISSLFGIEQEPGLIDLLSNESMRIEETIIRTDIPGVSLLPAGSIHENATELLASQRMADIVSQFAEYQDSTMFIFDSPPILATSESRVLASSVGQIVLVVRAGHTPQHSVIEALESLDAAKPINLVLNESGHGFGSDGQESYGYGHGSSVPSNRVLGDAV